MKKTRINVTLDAQIVQGLKKLACQDGRSVSNFLQTLINRELKKK